MSLSSPNQIVWHHFNTLRRLVGRLESIESEVEMNEDVGLSIMLCVLIVETFLNVFFRVVVTEPGFTQHQKKILADITKRRSLDYKLRCWPKIVFGRGLNFEDPPAKTFLSLKERRNCLMHFASSHETVNIPGTELRGLANTSALDTLTKTDATIALEVAEGILCVLFRLRGIQETQLPHALHAWTGRIPLQNKMLHY